MIKRYILFGSFIIFSAFSAIMPFYGCGALPPSIGIAISPTPPIIVGTTAILSCEASTSAGSSLTYVWSASGGTLSSTSGNIVQWTAPLTPGTYTVLVSVSDGSQSSSTTLNINVILNALSITRLSATPASVSLGAISMLSCEATSPAGKTPTYTWSLISGGGTLSSNSGQNVSWTAPTTPMTTTIGVTVNDTLATVTGVLSIDATSNPIINGLIASSYSILAGQSVVITCEATPAELGGSLTFYWTNSGGSLSSSTGTNITGGNYVTWTTLPTLPAGPYTITVKVTDIGTQQTNSATTTINVVSAGNPIINVTQGPPISVTCGDATGYPITCTVINVPIGDPIGISWTSPTLGTLSDLSNLTTTYTAPIAGAVTTPTSTALTLTVTDQVTSLQTSKTFNIIVKP